jgi:hypothetical protein
LAIFQIYAIPLKKSRISIRCEHRATLDIASNAAQ